MKKKTSRILVVLLLVCFVSAPFASAQYTDGITVLGGLGGISRAALEEMLDLVACKCTGGGGCECGGGGGGPCDCLCSCVKCAFLLAHPYGSVYMATDPALSTDTAMAAKFGGAWEAWGQGRVPLGMGSSGNTIGAAYTTPNYTTLGERGGYHTHTLIVSEMPSHSHTFDRPSWLSVENLNNGTYYSPRGYTTSNAYTGTTNSTGGNGAHNNVQPYVTCYMWRRADANPVPFVCPDAPCPSCCACGGGGASTGGACGCDLSGYALATDLPDMGLYYTKSEIDGAGFLTAADLNGYLTSVTTSGAGNPITATNTSGVVDLTFDTLGVGLGGTGQTSIAANQVLVGNGSGGFDKQTLPGSVAAIPASDANIATNATVNYVAQHTMIVPDYSYSGSNLITASGGTFTVTQAGFIQANTFGATTTLYEVQIGTSLASMKRMDSQNNGGGNSYVTGAGGIFPVSAGDIVRIYGQNITCYFYPAKAVTF